MAAPGTGAPSGGGAGGGGGGGGARTEGARADGAARAVACANIALVKYWGKRGEALNLPARGSLSATIAALTTITQVERLGSGASGDELVLDGEPASGRKLERVTRFLDLVRAAARARGFARVTSQNDFPAASGLASSASGFAALAVAAAGAFGLDADARSLSILARQGSGSAARSIFGGFVRMHGGVSADGRDAYAEPIQGARVELAAVIAVAPAGEKAIGSTDGMELTRRTSPYHEAWLAQVDRDLVDAEAALRAGDFAALAAVSEGSCLAMHANAMAARPGLIYFGPTTLWAIDRVRALRRAGVPVFFTIDAGPHLVAFTPPGHLERVAAALSENRALARIITSGVGGPARLV